MVKNFRTYQLAVEFYRHTQTLCLNGALRGRARQSGSQPAVPREPALCQL
jgi:hypothetical protein